jgi:MoaA/NifB/PqqE/SkfB family radical SAM enzyme
MCRQKHDDTRELPAELLQRNIGWEYVKRLEMIGGELLYQKEAKKLFAWLADHHPHIDMSITTNGTLLNEDWIELILRGSNYLVISVNATTPDTYTRVSGSSPRMFETVINNMQNLIKLQQRVKKPFTTIFKFTITPENVHECIPAIPFAEKLGCQKIQLGSSDRVFPYFQEHPEKLYAIEEYIHSYNGKIRIGIDKLRFGTFRPDAN